MVVGRWVCSWVWGRVAAGEESLSGREPGTEERRPRGRRGWWRKAEGCPEVSGCPGVKGPRSAVPRRATTAEGEGWPV